MSTSTRPEKYFKLLNCWEAKEIPFDTEHNKRVTLLEEDSLLSERAFDSSICTELTPMAWHEECIVVLCWLVFFGIPLWGPFLILYLFYVNQKIGIACIAVAVAISWLPSDFNTRLCYSHIASLHLKYFSFRAIWKTTLPRGRYIGVTPPHGLFPIAGLLGIFALPRFGGFAGRGAAAKAILCVPLIGNLLRMLGLIEASRKNLDKYLNDGETIGTLDALSFPLLFFSF